MTDSKSDGVKDSLWLRLTGGWSRWTGASVNRGIFGAAVTIGVLTVAAKVVSVARELAIAGTFGTSDVLDAFLIAFLLPAFAINVIAGSFNAALVPTFVKVRDQEGHEAAQRLLSNTVFWSSALLLGVVAALALSAGVWLPLIASGFSAGKLELTRTLFYLLLPTLVASGLATTWSAVLNASRRFALAALTPAISPALTLILVLMLGSTWGIHAVVAGAVLGAVIEVVVLGIGLRRTGFSLQPKWRGLDAHTKEVFGQYAPMVAGAFLMSGTLVVDQSMAAMLGPGSVAALNYGNRVVGFALGITSLALGTAVLPYFSRMVAARDWNNVRHTLRTYARLILVAMTPVVAALVVFSESIAALLYERGNFTSRDTSVVSQVQAFYALQIPFFLAGIVGVRLLNALGKARKVFLICVVNMVANVTGNLILMHHFGVAGIALATAMVYAISCGQIFLALAPEFRRKNG